ncbi:MAG: hypothetical protein SGILL_004873 [Bacillariaceae sp.]
MSNFQQLYALHWTGALGAAVMLTAHWFYLAAAFLALFGSETEGEGSGENAFTRGQDEMEKETESLQRERRKTRQGFRTFLDLRHDFMDDFRGSLDENDIGESLYHERNCLLATDQHLTPDASIDTEEMAPRKDEEVVNA